MFDTGSNYTIELKEDTKPYHAKPFVKIQAKIKKNDANCLITIDVLVI